MKKAWVLTLALSVLFSCKSAKVDDSEVNYLPARALVKKEQAGFPDAGSDQSHDVNQVQGHPGTAQHQRLPSHGQGFDYLDQFLKIGIPHSETAYNQEEKWSSTRRYQKRHFEGNFDLISEWLGTDFDFMKVQSLFLGESLLNLERDKYVSSVVNNQYELQPKRRNPMFDIYFYLDPTTFKISKEELRQPEKDQNLTILYREFDKISESLFPKGFLITAVGQQKRTVIDVIYKSVQFDVPLKFPFQMPEGYRNIELE